MHGSGCAGPIPCPLTLILDRHMSRAMSTAGLYPGAEMIFENAGPFVLTALAAFMAGAGIAAIFLRERGKTHQERMLQE